MNATAGKIGTADGLRRLTTVVAADICGYSRLAEADEAAALRTVKSVRASFERIVAARRGRIFHAAGDGFLAEFPSAADGVLAALEFVDDLKARDGFSPTHTGARVRAGVHAGDVIEQADGDLLGHGVNIAARLQAEADEDGVLVSLSVVNLVRGSIDAQFHRRGPLLLKNIDEPVEAYDAAAGRQPPTRSIPKLVARFTRSRPLLIVAALAISAILMSGLSTQLQIQKALGNSDTGQTTGIAEGAQSPGSQEDAEIEGAIRTLRFSTRAPSETVWMRGVLRQLRRSGNEIDGEIFNQLANQNLGAAVRQLNTEYEQKKAQLSDKEKLSYLLTLGGLTLDHAPGDSVAYNRAALDIDPNNYVARVRLGELYYAQSEYALADRAFREALRIGAPSPDLDTYARIKLAASLTIEEKYDEALELLNAALAKSETNGWDSLTILAYNRLAYVELKTRNFEKARKHLAVVTAFATADEFPDELSFANSALGRIAMDAGDFAAAKPYFDKAAALEQEIGRPVGLADTYFYVGLIEAETGDPKKAEQVFQTALDIARGARSFGYNNLKNMEVKNHIGKAYAFKRQGLTERACEEMKLADESDPKRDIIYNKQTTDLVRKIGCPFAPLNVHKD